MKNQKLTVIIESTLINRENNFTLLRLLAALAVLYGHSYALSIGISGHGKDDPISYCLIRFWGESLPSLAVDLFFVVSGFLVCASFIQRESLTLFIEARILRIYPGLIVSVFFCVLIGYMVTTESTIDYISSPITVGYIKHNILLINGIQFNLPGVFATNPYPISVNGSLWTLPIEVRMYFWIAVLGSLSILKNKKSFNLFFIILCLMYAQSSNDNFFIAHKPREIHLAFLFILGTFFYINRDTISLDFALLGALFILVLLTREYRYSLYVKSIFFAYLVLILALHPKLKLPSLDKWGDVSYGLYIYAFPVQQMIAFLLPGVHPLKMLMLAIVITFSLAILSWQLVEKPSLKIKGKFQFSSLMK